MKKNKMIFIFAIAFVLGISVLLFYYAPVKVIEDVIANSEYNIKEISDQTLKPVIRMTDPTVLSAEAQNKLVSLGLISPNKEGEIQSFAVDDYIDPKIYTEIISSVKLSRRFYNIGYSSYNLGDVIFEINLSSKYKMYIGNQINEVEVIGKKIPYYVITNQEEVSRKLVDAINDYLLSTSN